MIRHLILCLMLCRVAAAQSQAIATSGYVDDRRGADTTRVKAYADAALAAARAEDTTRAIAREAEKLSTSGTAADVNVAGTAIAAALSGKLSTGGTAADVNVSGTAIAAALSGKLSTSGTAADVNVSGTAIAAALSGKQATLVSATNIKTINGASVLGSGDLTVTGALPPLYIPIAVPVLAALAWTNQPAALSFWLSTATVAKGTTLVDLTNYTQVRLLVNKQGTSGAAAAKLILRYKASPWTQVVANYSDIGTSEVSVAINVNNTFLDTGWINLAAGAKADVFIDLLGSGGDGTLDPAFGYITAVFK